MKIKENTNGTHFYMILGVFILFAFGFTVGILENSMGNPPDIEFFSVTGIISVTSFFYILGFVEGHSGVNIPSQNSRKSETK